MKILFIHQNFPAQFRNIANYLAGIADNEVVAIGTEGARALPQVKLVRYGLSVGDIFAVHPFARRFDIECRRAEQIMYVALELEKSGFSPELVFVHCGWGENIPIRALFPNTKIVAYCEYYYQDRGGDVDFDPEWGTMTRDIAVGLKAKNAATLLALADADLAIAPTMWQRSTFPRRFQPLIEVCHDGIDVDKVRPDKNSYYMLPDGRKLSAGQEIVTYVSRNLEPVRGYHSFMRTLPHIMRARPHAHIVIVGGDGVSYGSSPPSGSTWKDVFLQENQHRLDLNRLHFLGHLSYDDYLCILQISMVHVYLTYPFVLSWSLLESMSAECLVLASDTAPVHEVIDGKNGILVDFFDYEALASGVVLALKDPERFRTMRKLARATITARYARAICVRQLLELIP